MPLLLMKRATNVNLQVVSHILYTSNMKRILIFLFFAFMLKAFINPVQGERDSPDPGVIYHEGAYYAVTTGGWDNHHFPIWKSVTGINFTHVGWALPTAPTWTTCCDYWAPQLHIINGKFLLYFTARDKAGKLTIGAALSSNVLGPYSDRGSPLVTNSSEGVIDATVLRRGTSNYIVYKVDGNAHGHPTQFWAVLLDPTGMNIKGDPQLLLKNDQAWERGIIEGQWFIEEGGYFYLFYSGCGYNNDCYAVGVARSTNALGPYTKYTNNPILKTKPTQTAKSWEGPGHCSVIKSVSGQFLMFYHAWPHGAIGTKRVMLLDKITFVGGWAKVGEGYPSEGQMPDPK